MTTDREPEHSLIGEMIAALTDGDLFTDREARLLLKSIQSETREGMPDQVERIILWARDVRGKQQVLELIFTLAEQGIIAVSHDGTDVCMRLTLDPDQVGIHP